CVTIPRLVATRRTSPLDAPTPVTHLNRSTAFAVGAALVVGGCGTRTTVPEALQTATPIKHLVVIFDENVSFDHYFGTYPVAANLPGEPRFVAAPGTPAVNGLTPALLQHNPNASNPANPVAGTPFRLDRVQATSSQSHDYSLEQLAYDNGAADLFPRYTGSGMTGGVGSFATPALVMGYYDGNTVTALWNYAQHFAMNDNAYSDQYGPSTPGALNLIAGQTDGATIVHSTYASYEVPDGQGGVAIINDVSPAGDVCSDTLDVARMTGRNIGDLLNVADISWGWFQGGFDLSVANANGSTGCLRTTASAITKLASTDYLPHHEPFQFYPSTANPKHTRPSALAAIGTSRDAANHQYDLRDFFAAVGAGAFPAVTFLKAAAFQDGHAGYSDPLDEQTFLTETINFLEERPEWKQTAIIVLYDDSDGWYDHQMAPVGNASFDPQKDRLNGQGQCGLKGKTPQAVGVTGAGPVNGRCGPGTRQPFLVISPWAKVNAVDHTLITQSSVIRFIEDNWLHGARIGGGSFDATATPIEAMFDFRGPGNVPPLFLNDSTGTPVGVPSRRLPN
ncbi:MAG TPA: alkaline phosphatase family protein, partial [Gemmatimonadaceae bacterium]|nr:alkaline phosphatase family protein [Gemmatimonadaceae bacterium]